MNGVKESLLKLKKFCEDENYMGWDPYDGLNSKLFKNTPFKYSKLARLAWIQAFKISPINFRRLFMVPKEYNSKGVGLFLSAYCNLYKLADTNNNCFGSKDEILNKINFLANLLLELKSPDYSNACWGYNFDWQNRVFYQPKFTPTVVVTSFCGEALFEAYEITKNKHYLTDALSSCKFITDDLNRTKYEDDRFIFSYSPLDNSQVYNASLLGAKLLAVGYSYNKNNSWKKLSTNAAITIANKQNSDGSWIYGEDRVQNWIDSFHTGFNLECIWKIMKHTKDYSLNEHFDFGLKYYLNNFFLNEEVPKYYNNKTYPIDIHSPAQLIMTLCYTGSLKNNLSLAQNVLKWTIKNMKTSSGAYRYQIKKYVSTSIPYIRWSQAWMFKAFSVYLKSTIDENLD